VGAGLVALSLLTVAVGGDAGAAEGAGRPNAAAVAAPTPATSTAQPRVDVSRGLGGDDPLGADGRLPDGSSVERFAPVFAAASSLRALAVPPTDTLMALANPPVSAARTSLGIPKIVLDAYETAARRLATEMPRCGMSVALLAGIGQAESRHANGGRVTADGTTREPILGPVLDGSNNTAAVSDTDNGRLDGNTTWDRAVGPMQFLPATWRRYQSDGNNDGVADINNIYDASLAAARYLCAGGGDVRKPAQAAAAVFRYNHSATYVATVLSWAAAYAGGITPTPGSTGKPDATATPAPPPGIDTMASPTPDPPSPSASVVYTVKRGDNLSSIAWWFHVHGYGPIYDANRHVIGADPDLIFPGQQIKIIGARMKVGD